jgi:hypothetical protein
VDCCEAAQLIAGTMVLSVISVVKPTVYDASGQAHHRVQRGSARATSQL